MTPHTHDQWTVSLVILALICVGLTDTLWQHRVFWRTYLVGVRDYWLTPVAGRHAATRNLPRPRNATPQTNGSCGQPPLTRDLVAVPGPGRLEDLTEPTLGEVTDWFDEISEEALEWAEATLPAATEVWPDYDAPPPPRFTRTTAIAPGVYVPLTDDTLTDLPRPGGHAGLSTSGPGQPYHPHAGPPAWRQHEPWTWNGHTWIRQAPAGAAWIDHLCTMPLRQLEAA
jgi:hypothetical protein